MQENEALIAIYSEKGQIIGQKTRKTVDKKQDILKSVNVLAFDEKGKLLIIKQRNPSLWKDKWGGSCAGLVRHKEAPIEAAGRTLKRELGIYVQPKFLGEKFYDFGGIKRFWNVFVVKSIDNISLNKNDFSDFKWVKLEDLRGMIERGECMPTLEASLNHLKI